MLELPDYNNWSFVVRYDPRGSILKYNVVKEDGNEEEANVEG